MERLKSLCRWLLLYDTQPEVAHAQMRVLQRQMPLLYLLLIVNSWAVSYTHIGMASATLTFLFPSVLSLVCGIRLLVWVRRSDNAFSALQAVRLLRITLALAGILAVSHIAWALALGPTGSAYEQAHVAIFIAITVIGCIFCLTSLPQAAVLVAVLVTVPYIVYYIVVGNPVFSAIALNLLLVTLVALKVVLTSFRGFEQLIRSEVTAASLSEQNAHLAHTCALTKLPNRRYFFAELERRMALARAGGGRLAIGIFDLDRFKAINDTYGHAMGDQLLSLVGERLTALTLPGIVIARLGGDEFGFIAADEAGNVPAFAQSICDRLLAPFPVEDVQLSVGCSCGVAFYPDSADTAAGVFDRSDHALYFSKTSSRGTVTVYSQAHETIIGTRRSIETALQSADLEREFDVHLQPIVDTAGKGVVAFECLARWNSPVLGAVRPDDFIAAAERTGLIHHLTLALLRAALAKLPVLPAPVGLSFNLSALDMVSPQTILSLVSIIRKSEAEASRLTFELTETAVMRDFDVAADSIALLRSLGCKVALDDFGTGYSSLGHLHRLPIDRIKIDRSFVRDLAHPSGRKLVASVLGLSKAMDLECIVEGVETPEHQRALQEMGCTLFQGYLFAPPMPLDRALDWMTERRALRETA